LRPVAGNDTPTRGESIHITLDERRRSFTAGGTLRGRFRVAGDTAETLRGVELKVLWYTEGKGDTDAGIVYSKTFEPRGEQDCPFSVTLPLLPLTYHGRLLKIHWMVRVRVDRKWRKDLVHDYPFTVLSGKQTIESR
jgi:hypothetical protein